MNIRMLGLISILAAFAVLSGCANKGGLNDGADGAMGGDGTVDVGAGGDTSGLGEDGALIFDPLDDPNSELFVRTIYFDYDSADIRADSMETVRQHGDYLVGNPDRTIRLEGHADERGTREYNLALGEQRAQAVQKIMQLQGVQDVQIEIVSFGEERPAVEGIDESSWQMNRRVEIVY